MTKSVETMRNGDIKLFFGDCLTIMDKLDSQSIDLVIADPPFGVTACSWDQVIPFKEMWEKLERIRTRKCPVLFFTAQPFTSKVVLSNEKEFKYEWIWKKSTPTGHLNAKKMPLRSHENILCFYKSLPTYNPQMWESTPMHSHYTVGGQTGGTYGNHKKVNSQLKLNRTQRYPIDTIFFARVNGQSKEKTKISTQKPVPLIEYFIKTYTNEGDIVLDFTMGSGTTAIACKNLGRRFIGIENNSDHFEIARERIRDSLWEDLRKTRRRMDDY